MQINLTINYPFESALSEVSGQQPDDIMILKAKDRFFVGSGCETPFEPDMPKSISQNRDFLIDSYHSALNNLSICAEKS